MRNKLRSVMMMLAVSASYACSDTPTQVTSDIEDRVRRSNDFVPGDCDISFFVNGTVAVGDTVGLNIQYQDCSNGNYYIPEYPIVAYATSENTGIATIQGWAPYNLFVVGVAAGSTHLRGFVGPNGQYKRIALTVGAARALTTLYSSPSSISSNVGATQQLSITGKDQYGVAFATGTVSYSTGNSAVATVSSTGLVTLVGPGSTTITASAGGKSVNVSVTAVLGTPSISASISGSGSGNTRLDWAAVTGATSYTVDVSYFEPQCDEYWGCWDVNVANYSYTVYTNSYVDPRTGSFVFSNESTVGYAWSLYSVRAKVSSATSASSNLVKISIN